MATDQLFGRVKPDGPNGDGTDRMHIHYISEAICGYAGGEWGRTAIKSKNDQWLIARGGTALTPEESAELDLIFDHIDTLNANTKATYCIFNVSPAFMAGSSGLVQETEFWDTLNITEPT